MWGCNYDSGIPFIGSGFPNDIISLLISVALIVALVWGVTLIFRRIRNPGGGTARDGWDSLEFLKIRYAKGEITQDEYAKMKSVLMRS